MPTDEEPLSTLLKLSRLLSVELLEEREEKGGATEPLPREDPEPAIVFNNGSE